MDTKKLRQKILDLAIHGKLVPQDPNDEPASVLLERIKAEKERLIKEGKIKKSKKSTKASDTPHYENVPFEVPSSWVWCTLGDLAFYKKGPFGSSLTKAMFVPKSNDTYKVYEQKNAIQKDNTLGSYFITKEKYDSLIGFAIQPYDIIVSCAGTIGETYVLPQNSQEGIINQALMLIRLYSREIEQFYLLYFDFILKEEAYKESKGTAIKNIPPFDVLKGFHIPLPPISEQQRILKEIEHWFSLIDIIERGKDDLQTTIKQAKSKILDLAIHGKLVPQDPNDEPASELLKRINPKAEVTCDNGHKWKLPQSWCWAKGRQIFLPMKSTKPHNDEFLYIDIDSIDNKRQIINKIKSIKTANAPSRASRYTQKGDVVFSMVRPYLRNIAKVSVDGCIASTGFYVCSPIEDLNSEYCYYLMISDYVVTGLNQFMKGDNSPSINKSHIDEWLFPLPPFPEQQRIVQKIEKLFSLLDHIKKSLEV
ncbi:restriction endonuclease subunit S [Bacteroides uniformis]|uniref:restriction endonuclease subunit S n=1 Tax=Bacteroides uniformis TaxID=820 RepID=UPI001FC7F423|nr:restriction endonuclease subunit S [Bacteroides uniformis]GKH38681.1 type I restriction endonuclease EcoAI [Bacteroides uniformis]